MSILIEQSPAHVTVAALFEAPSTAAAWHSPTRGSIVALDAADAFAALLHHRIMVESVRIEGAERGADH